MVAIDTNQGIMPQFFSPEKPGTDYAATPYLERLAKHRGSFELTSTANTSQSLGIYSTGAW